MANRLKTYLFLKVLLTSLFFSSTISADIFGTDDRNWPRPGSQEELLSRSVAVGVLSSILEINDKGTYDIYADNLSDYMCLDERFSDEPSLAYACTGFLVAPDLLMTAGHCATNFKEVFNSSELYCEVYTWMFDYRTNSQVKAKVSDVDPNTIYKCKEIIYAVADLDEPSRDFALIRLDRPVLDREPLTIAKTDLIVGEPVTMIGSPMGMPSKFTDNAVVLENISSKNNFTTNLDAFSGNSGSPVFNDRNEVVGILVSGSPSQSTYTDPINKCERYNHCDEDGKNCMSDNIKTLGGIFENGSDVQKLSKYKELIQQFL